MKKLVDASRGSALAIFLVLAGSFAHATSATTHLRQSFDMQVPVPPTPVTIAGTSRLVYELHLTNFAQDGLALKRVEILAVEDETVIADMRGEALNRRLGQPGKPSAKSAPRAIGPGARAVIYLELEVEDGAVPRALEHRVEYEVADSNTRESAIVKGARIPVRAELPVILGPPLHGGPWAAIYEPFWERGHRRVLYAVDGRARIPGRYAIDWIKLDADGRFARGDSATVSNWYGYGAQVLAVADSVVAATRDGIQESASIAENSKNPLENASGNYIALDLGDGRYALYEHLKPGSIRVKPGERVGRGQVIGSLGFTGDSTGPHLHFHVADASSPLRAEGLPYVLDSFDVLGAFDSIGALGNEPWSPLGDTMDSRRHAELPAPIVVIEFRPEDTSR